MWHKNPKCKECGGDGLVHFDGEDIWDECSHCCGRGYVGKNNLPFFGGSGNIKINDKGITK